VARYRLRFLLQEFDLAKGATLLGRSAECHVTIEDPLVSRQHARILIDGDDAVFEDLGSRNGVKINGVLVKSPTRLKDGDRIRIGTQELVFCQVGAGAASPAKTTGFLRYCANCRLPYPQELAACPACGATEQTDEETLSGQFGATSKHSWSVQLLVDVTEKALSLGRTADAVRMLQRAKSQLEERIASAGSVDAEQLARLGVSAAKVALSASEPGWACWVAYVYGQLGLVPPSAVSDALGEVAAKMPNDLAQPLADLVTRCRTVLNDAKKEAKAEDRAALARLEQLYASTEAAKAAAGGATADSTMRNPALS
jgi:predicted component of type VI protein secretion system